MGDIHGPVHLQDGASLDQCLRDLRITDPREDKDRIESKDRLLRDCYAWVVESPDFRRVLGKGLRVAAALALRSRPAGVSRGVQGSPPPSTPTSSPSLRELRAAKLTSQNRTGNVESKSPKLWGC